MYCHVDAGPSSSLWHCRTSTFVGNSKEWDWFQKKCPFLVSQLSYGKNFRPVSNLTFIGKLIERFVLRRLINEHLCLNNLNCPLQSAYKKHHSTETLLIRIWNDLLVATDEKKLHSALSCCTTPDLKSCFTLITITGTWITRRSFTNSCQFPDFILKYT